MQNNQIQIGTITLTRSHEFTQYSECAAWSDYVTCDPQTVPLFYDGYWAFATFRGVLTRSTYPSNARQIGRADTAHVQTQACGGLGDWLLKAGNYDINLSSDWMMKQVGVYDDGRAILALTRNETATQAA